MSKTSREEALSLSRKQVRELVGFTFLKSGGNPEVWFNQACEFNKAACVLSDSYQGSPSSPYYYNAGFSIELALKATALAKAQSFNTDHRLNELAKTAGVTLTKDQECTLELLSEIVIWSGRYPIPKKEGQWDNYYDIILEKHILRERSGNTFRTLANRKRFPTLENYLAIWKICENAFRQATAEKA